MNKLSLALLVSLVMGCSNSDGSIGNANRLYANGDYEKAISKTLKALRDHEYGAEAKAELNYIMAQSHEKLGEASKAAELYKYVLREFPKTKVALLAKTEVE
jgi:TolA-binding protein